MGCCQELGWFDRDENSSGAIAGRLSLDTTHIRGAVGDQIGLVAQNLVTVIAGYIIAFTAGWRMTLVVTACVPVLGLATWIHTSFMLGVSNKVRYKHDWLSWHFCWKYMVFLGLLEKSPSVTVLLELGMVKSIWRPRL